MAKRFVKGKGTKKDLASSLDGLLGGKGKKLDTAMAEAPEATVSALSKDFAYLPIAKINANPDQPRKEFEEGPLMELAESIKVHGIIQPLTVRHMGDGSYQIISGERRFRASKKAGLKEVPAFIRTANDQTLLEMALIENIQRQDLNPMEVAYSYLRLQNEFNLTQKEVGERVGKQRSTVTNYLSVLKSHTEVQNAIRDQEISIGAAKAIAGIKDLGLQKVFLKEVLDNPSWNVRTIESAANSYKANKKGSKPKSVKQARREEMKKVENAFKEFFGAKVKVFLEEGEEYKGHVLVQFEDKDMLNHIYKAVE
ncbi:chromosome partitioning protein ParB [Lewinellaceae bacterium SD302]|nr:chromosome partitioning protein ParB [Lewinellaceae bacterium SD302]